MLSRIKSLYRQISNLNVMIADTQRASECMYESCDISDMTHNCIVNSLTELRKAKTCLENEILHLENLP